MNFEKIIITAGDTISFSEFLPDAGADSILNLRMKCGSEYLEATATKSGSEFVFSFAFDKSAGNYTYQFVLLADDSEAPAITTIQKGMKVVAAAIGEEVDEKSYWLVIYNNLCETYARLSKVEYMEISVAGRMVRYDWNNREKLLKDIHNAEIRAGLKPAVRTIKTRFI